ncbi:MAG: hypothetical protein JKY37_06795 [Nannocystaceae bacterium]|nr:hypothetical protein [Nannocystaceae bacterium]
MTCELARLQTQLQAGVILVRCLFSASHQALTHLDPVLIEDLRRWVVGTVSIIPNTDGAALLQCGQLRRESNGTWWWGEHLLGRDGDPLTSIDMGSDTGVMAIILGDALEAAANRLLDAGDDGGFRAVRRVLVRYQHWQSTGTW